MTTTTTTTTSVIIILSFINDNILQQPGVPLLIGGTVNLFRRRNTSTFLQTILLDTFIAIALQHWLRHISPDVQSIVPYWNVITHVLSQWTSLDVLKNSNILRPFIQSPLGNGASKVIQVLVAVGLWRVYRGEYPKLQLLTPIPTLRIWVLLLVLSVAVNIVLYIWSTTINTVSGGTQHKGVDRMVSSSRNRPLTFEERMTYGGFAFVNAVCEEITSRFFWYQEFETYHHHHGSNGILTVPNLGQSTIFGIWHYYGIPR
jgi:hypothetical protein